MMTLACLSVHYCLGDLQVMMFAMSASVSVALQSVNLFAPCPLHCMFAQDFVSACLDVFGGSYYLPVEIRLHVCLCTHACLVIQVLSCLHKTQRLFAHLFTCPYVSVHVFLFTQINTCVAQSLVCFPPQVCSGHSICLLM